MAEIQTETVKVHTIRLTDDELDAVRAACKVALTETARQDPAGAGDYGDHWRALIRLGLPNLRGTGGDA